MQKRTRKRKNESGNVLFYILIAVVLFGALGYVVSNMMRGGDADMIGDEQAKLYAGEILDYARIIRSAVHDMRISNGCSDTDISFENSTEAGYTNGTNTACQVFHSNGGDTKFLNFPEKFFEPADSASLGWGITAFTGDASVLNIGTDCTNESCNELLIMINPLKNDICAAINNKLGNGNDTTDEVISNVYPRTQNYFDGTYDYDASRIIGDDATGFDGQSAGCLQRSFYTGATFYQVLIAR